MNRPVIAISMGDPFGNGPEITVKALSRKEIYERCRPLVVGDRSSMEYACKVVEAVCGIRAEIHVIRDISEALFTCGTIDLLDLGLVPEDRYPKLVIPPADEVSSSPDRKTSEKNKRSLALCI